MKPTPLPLACACALALSLPLSGHAAVWTYGANLTGAAEAPAVASPASGWVLVTVDDGLNTLRVQTSVADLIGATTAAHIHCCAAAGANAGAATTTPSFLGFPQGVTALSFDNTYDMSLAASFGGNFLAARGGNVALAWSDLLNGMASGMTYFNVHTSSFTGGEVRGQLMPTAVPEPGVAWLLAAGLAGLAVQRRRR